MKVALGAFQVEVLYNEAYHFCSSLKCSPDGIDSNRVRKINTFWPIEKKLAVIEQITGESDKDRILGIVVRDTIGKSWLKDAIAGADRIVDKNVKLGAFKWGIRDLIVHHRNDPVALEFVYMVQQSEIRCLLMEHISEVREENRIEEERREKREVLSFP